MSNVGRWEQKIPHDCNAWLDALFCCAFKCLAKCDCFFQMRGIKFTRRDEANDMGFVLEHENQWAFLWSVISVLVASFFFCSEDPKIISALNQN